MAGKTSLINLITEKAQQFGLEAQPPVIAGIVRALEEFTPQNRLKSLERRDQVYTLLQEVVEGVEKTPTGFMISAETLKEITPEGEECSPRELATLLAMILLKEHHLVTIPAVGMPGVSTTIRLDLSAADAQKLDDSQIVAAIQKSLKRLREIVGDDEACLSLLYE